MNKRVLDETQISMVAAEIRSRVVLCGSDLSEGDEIDLAWCGGFADGDGSIFLVWQPYKDRKPTLRLVFCITQNDREILERFRKIVGEKAHMHKPRRRLGQNRQSYSLRYTGKHALRVIRKLRPYLYRKAAEADLVMVAWNDARLGEYPGPHGFPPEIWKKREFYREKLRRMK